MLEYVHGERYLFQREELPSVGIHGWDKAFVSKRRTAECWYTCMGQGIYFKEKTAECWNMRMGRGICFKEENNRVLEYVHGERHLFQREEQPNIGIHAGGKAFVSMRRTAEFWNTCMGQGTYFKEKTAECWNTCMGQGICFKEKNSRILEYMHEARHLFQREEQPSVGIRAWGKAFVSKRRTVEYWNTCRVKGIFFIEKNSRVLEYVHGARHLFQREEQPSVGICAWGEAFVSKRRTAECWNTCMGQGICFKEKNSRVLEYVHGARHLFQREEQPTVGIRAWGKAFVTKRRTAMC